MLKIGKKLTAAGATEGGAKSQLGAWESHFADCMPSNERVAQLMELEGVPSLGEFVAVYEAPVDIEMEADSIWPPERAVLY